VSSCSLDSDRLRQEKMKITESWIFS